MLARGDSARGRDDVISPAETSSRGRGDAEVRRYADEVAAAAALVGWKAAELHSCFVRALVDARAAEACVAWLQRRGAALADLAKGRGAATKAAKRRETWARELYKIAAGDRNALRRTSGMGDDFELRDATDRSQLFCTKDAPLEAAASHVIGCLEALARRDGGALAVLADCAAPHLLKAAETHDDSSAVALAALSTCLARSRGARQHVARLPGVLATMTGLLKSSSTDLCVRAAARASSRCDMPRGRVGAAARIFRGDAAADRGAESSQDRRGGDESRGDAAAATGIFRGERSR